MEKNKQLLINLLTTLLVLIVNIFINFGLSNYIVENIGEEAYGFISLANNFISYALIFTTALNSMAGRFITIDIHKGNEESANKYFSSVLIANVFIIALLVIPSIILVWFLEYIIKIPTNLIMDVKILFTLIIINFFISLLGGVYTIATYCRNKLYLSSIKNMESSIIKALVIIGLFICFNPAVFYVGLATLISSAYIVLYNVKFTKKLLPEIKIKKENFSIKKVVILLRSGLWNSLSNLGNVLADGLDLIISNLLIGPKEMGIVALSKIPSNVLNTMISSIGNVFQPQIISYYAKNDIESTIKETKQGMKICGIFGNIPFAFIVVCGISFCELWMPSVDSFKLNVLCILTFINVFVGGICTPLYNIFTITNKVKLNAILNITSGIFSTILVIVLLKTTNLGVYAIVGTSAVIGIIKGLLITPLYTAHCLKKNTFIFVGTIIRYITTTFVMIGIFYAISLYLSIDSWVMLFISIIVYGLIGVIINYFILLNSYERKTFIDVLKKIRK